MDTIQKSNKSQRNKNKRRSSSMNNPLKVVYISSPMKVKTSATRFRSLVQHLTGKNSDISQYLDDGNMNDFREIGYEDEDSKEVSDQRQVLSSVSSVDDTPTSSESFLGPMDHSMFGSQIEGIEQFAGLFSTDSFFDASQLDVLGSYDELL